ncbi:hypothetical protein [Granulicella sp. dw_53]|uniref:hypothetical protein n=1 Tax=Granulicella sp. dw_53 TaxID=2719792 RepID=UPI001BD322A6|nr:hypothetical protein [Granulicella sp. dw_53]
MRSSFISRQNRILQLVTLLALLATAMNRNAWAQAVPTATGPGPYVALGVTGALFKSNYGDRTVGGFGAYLDLNPHRDYGVEIEGQTLRYNQEAGSRLDTLLVGPRISHGTNGFVPYVKFLVGTGRWTAPYGFGVGNYLVLAPGAGVDFSLNRKIRVRVLQVEYQSWRDFTFGNLHPYGISSGISIQIF